MKQLTSAVTLIPVLIYLIITYSCATNISLSVAVPQEFIDNQPGTTKLYLLNSDDCVNFQNIKLKNQEYYKSKLLAVSDSIKTLKEELEDLQKELELISNNCSTLVRQLPIDYCEKISVKTAKIAKYGDIWQLIIELTNNGDEDLKGLKLSVLFKDDYLINGHEYAVLLQPGHSSFSKLHFDLSNNLPLQYSIVSYPGGLSRVLNEALTVRIDSVISDFTNSLSDCRIQQEQLSDQIETIGITLDLYSDQAIDYLNKAVIVPVNHIMEENLRLVEFHASLSSADTVTFNGLKKELYQLLVYSDMTSDSTQYFIPVDMSKINQLTIDVSRYQPTLFFMNDQSFIENLSKYIGQ